MRCKTLLAPERGSTAHSKINQPAHGQQCRLIEVGQNKAPSEILIPRGRVVFSLLRLGLCYATK